MNDHRILKPGRNCWRLEHADRVAVLIDGDDYFRTLYNAITRAQHTIQIVAWDIDSRFELIRGPTPATHWPERLGDLLNAVIKNRPGLQASILDWDFAMIYASDREFMPIYKFNWKSNRRLRFCLDDNHPIGASQHQKVVVIDDAIAFAGGMDITKGRWDTHEHRPFDPHRDGDGRAHRPYHDAQMAVSGDAAAALGELTRQRWARTGRRVLPRSRSGSDPWPPDLQPDLTDVTVAIALTEAQYRNHPEVREVETLYLDAIAAARRLIYIENQYFTSGRIGEALAHRLEKDTGPEIVLLLPLMTDGWLSQSTMDIMRERLIRRLRQSDRHDRFRVYYPHVAGQGDQAINLHAKILVIDDELIRIGSANLNNRSMGLDSECDLAIEACDYRRIQGAIANIRNRLLSEHLNCTPQDVASTVKIQDSAIAGIEALRSEGRSLYPLPIGDHPDTKIDITTSEMIDPERPVDPDEFMRHFVDDSELPSASRRIGQWVTLLLVLSGLAAAWRWTPLNQWLNIGMLYDAVQHFKETPAIPFFILTGYIVGSLIAVPITLLVITTVLTFGPWPGFAYAFGGSVLGALISFGIGRLLGRNMVRQLAGSRLNTLSRRLARRGLLAVIAVRLIPIAPFTIINMVAGASHIRFRDFLFGTGIGMAPGIIAIAFFTDRIAASIASPDLANFTALALVMAAIVVVAFSLRHWLRTHVMASQDSPHST